MTRSRLDVMLVERGLVPSRERARAAILGGNVRVDGAAVTKVGQLVTENADIEVIASQRFVSRGGYKLEGALDEFGVEVRAMRAIDVGASTGGFTDCLLQRGASGVAAVDVGYGQLAWELRNDPRVAVFERTNIRYADPEALGAPFDLAVVDVSFIGLDKVLPTLDRVVGEKGAVLALVKPQFEAGKGRVGKKGVVRDPEIHAEVVRSVSDAARDRGWVVRGVAVSPIRGPEGNIEFWLWLARSGEPCDVTVESVVERAHGALGDPHASSDRSEHG